MTGKHDGGYRALWVRTTNSNYDQENNLMRKHIGRKVVAGLASAGFVAVIGAGAVGAEPVRPPDHKQEAPKPEPTDSHASSDVDQDAVISVDLIQSSASNTGLNLALNGTEQDNSADGSNSGYANGGDAYSTAGGFNLPFDVAPVADSLVGPPGPSADASSSSASGASSASADASATATAGDGGKNDGSNTAKGDNTAASGNDITTGAADSENDASGDISQKATNKVTNTATATGGAATSASTAGNATAASSTPTKADASAHSDVDQSQAVEVEIGQEAVSNSGANAAVNLTGQSNTASGENHGAANGGDASAEAQTPKASSAGGTSSAASATAEAPATAGDGGTNTGSNTAAASNTAKSDNSITTGAATAKNSTSLTISQTADNTVDNSATATGDAG